LSERQKLIIACGCFMHDAGKAKPTETRMTSATHGSYPAHQGSNIVPDSELKEIASEFGITDEDSIQDCIAVARTIENPQTLPHLTDMLRNPPSSPQLMHVAVLADELASLDGPGRYPRPGSQLQLNLERLGLSLYACQTSAIRGVLTQLVHKAMSNLISARGGRCVSVFPEGTLFVSRVPIADPPREEVVTAVKGAIEHYLKDQSVDDLAAAAFGSITGTVLVAPEFITRDAKVMRAFWRHVEQQPFISDPKLPPLPGRDKWISAIRRAYNLQDQSLISKRFKEIRATQYMTQVFKEVCRLSEDERIRALVVKRLSDYLALGDKSAENLEEEIQAIAQTSPANKCIDLYHIFESSSVVKGLRRKEAIAKLSEIYEKISLELLSKNLLRAGTPTQEIAEALVNELNEPMYSAVVPMWNQAESRYLQGKTVGGVACACCSGIPSERAAEALIGDGTETFTNLVRGGTNLGNANKVMICSLCSFEAKLRRIQVSDPDEAVYVFPQVQAGRSTGNAWARILRDLFEATRSEGIPSLKNTQTWAEIARDGRIAENSTELLARLRRSTEAWRAVVVRRIITDEYGTEKDGLEAFLANCEPQRSGAEYKTVEEAATAVVRDEVRPTGLLGERIKTALRESTGTGSYFEAPNYILFLLKGLRQRQGGTEESETSYFIRKMLIGLVLAKLFLASVSFAAIPLEIKYMPASQGYLEAPRKIGLLAFYAKLHVSDWVKTEQLDDVLEKVAALVLVETLLRSKDAEPGKDALFSLSKEIPGRILNKYVQATGRLEYTSMVELLDAWSEP